MAEKRIKSEQTFDYDTVTAIIYCMLKDGVVLGARHYETMSALSGTRTASAFQHDFRDAKRRAKDLLVKGDVLGPKNKDDDNSTELKNGKKATAKSTGKRGRKPKDAQQPAKTGGFDENETMDENANKKIKLET